MSEDLEHKHEYPENKVSDSAVLGSVPGHAGGITPLHGEQFAKYLLVGEIARGGMGEVYLAVQQGPEGFSKVVVIKRMVRHLTKNAEFIRMFIDEARLAARLEHPNIVKTYEFGDHEGQYYTVMEFLAGEDLRKMLHKLHQPPHRRLALPLVVHIAAQICNGLHFAHELTDPEGRPLNLVHRDVNPANVIVTYTGEVKVIDFGVAKVSTATQKTLAGVIKGKVAYMSPEHILARDVDHRSDIFSTGIILWEMLTGRPLFARDCDAATMYSVMNDPIPIPSKERPDVPPQLDTIVARALARTPGQRFATADDMRAALDELAATLPKCDGRAVGRMMEKLFGNARAQAKRSITQSRSLAYNIALVMKMTISSPTAGLPTVVLPSASLPLIALPTRKPRNVALPIARGRRWWWIIDGVVASVCGVVAIASFGPWAGPPLVSPPPRPELAIGQDAAPGVAVAPPAAVPPGSLPLQAVTGTPVQGTLTVDTPSNAIVYLDGKAIEHGSLSHRLTESGTHELMVKIPGRAPLKRLISIAAARETKLKLDLVQPTAIAALHQPAPRQPASDRASIPANRSPATKGPPQAQGSGSNAESESVAAGAEAKPEIANAEPPVVPAVKQPGLDVAATRMAVRSQIAALQQCYERAKMDDANLKGEVTARIEVAVDGSIANVQIFRSTLNSPQAEGCITREIVRWRFPKPSGGVAMSFLYPFVFE